MTFEGRNFGEGEIGGAGVISILLILTNIVFLLANFFSISRSHSNCSRNSQQNITQSSHSILKLRNTRIHGILFTTYSTFPNFSPVDLSKWGTQTEEPQHPSQNQRKS